MLSNLQRQILDFAKEESFHASLSDFIRYSGVSEADAISALKELKSKRIVSCGPSVMNSFLGVTNYGWSLMGWK